MRPFKDGCRADSEVQLALVAAVETTLASRDAITTSTGRADCSLRPEARFQVNPCCLLVGEHREELEGAATGDRKWPVALVTAKEVSRAKPVRKTIMLIIPEPSLLERIAAVLSPAFKIIKVAFDLRSLKTGHL
jgi:hypothetical protein